MTEIRPSSRPVVIPKVDFLPNKNDAKQATIKVT
jgi:hypothetical protein